MKNQQVMKTENSLYKMYMDSLIEVFGIHDVHDLTPRHREILTALYNDNLKPEYREDALFEGEVNPNTSSYVTRFMKGEINESELAQSLAKIMVDYHRDAIDEEYQEAVVRLIVDQDEDAFVEDENYCNPKDFVDTTIQHPFRLA